MKTSAQFPQYHDDTAGLVEFVEAADAAGLHRLWLGDHVVWPVEYTSKYPFAVGPDDARFGAAGDRAGFLESSNQKFLEAMVTAGFILGASKALRVGLSVMILPMRNVALAAKQIATADVLSGGRIVVGVGAGWLREEFEVLGAAFDRRYRRMEEGIEALRALWGSQPASYNGELITVPPVYCEPTPTSPNGTPIFIGGHSGPALERTARFADGIVFSEVSPAEFAQHSRRLDELLVEAGRPKDAVERVVLKRLKLGGAADPTEAARTLEEYRDAGCDEFALYASPSRSAAENADRVSTFASIVADLDLGTARRR